MGIFVKCVAAADRANASAARSLVIRMGVVLVVSGVSFSSSKPTDYLRWLSMPEDRLPEMIRQTPQERDRVLASGSAAAFAILVCVWLACVPSLTVSELCPCSRHGYNGSRCQAYPSRLRIASCNSRCPRLPGTNMPDVCICSLLLEPYRPPYQRCPSGRISSRYSMLAIITTSLK
jgi:hypothetical protein